jgi:hypothetical protein
MVGTRRNETIAGFALRGYFYLCLSLYR